MDLSSHPGIHQIFIELLTCVGCCGGCSRGDGVLAKKETLSATTEFLFDFDEDGTIAAFDTNPCIAI